MEQDKKQCRVCGVDIPKARLRAVPGTRVCVRCSEKIGGESELEVTLSSTGKAGSLKKTGQDIQVRVKPKSVR